MEVGLYNCVNAAGKAAGISQEADDDIALELLPMSAYTNPYEEN
jgi:hypothetical protein